jgi:hypothetical protein
LGKTIKHWGNIYSHFTRYMAMYAEKFPETIPHLAKDGERDGNISK